MARHGRAFPIPPHITVFDIYPDPVPPVGQPVQVRTWGIPTASGSRARTGGWNSFAATAFVSYLIRLLVKHLDG